MKFLRPFEGMNSENYLKAREATPGAGAGPLALSEDVNLVKTFVSTQAELEVRYGKD